MDKTLLLEIIIIIVIFKILIMALPITLIKTHLTKLMGEGIFKCKNSKAIPNLIKNQVYLEIRWKILIRIKMQYKVVIIILITITGKD